MIRRTLLCLSLVTVGLDGISAQQPVRADPWFGTSPRPRDFRPAVRVIAEPWNRAARSSSSPTRIASFRQIGSAGSKRISRNPGWARPAGRLASGICPASAGARCTSWSSCITFPAGVGSRVKTTSWSAATARTGVSCCKSSHFRTRRLAKMCCSRTGFVRPVSASCTTRMSK